MMKYLCSKISMTCILILMFAIFANINAYDCDPTMCNNVCGDFKMNGTCKGNECDCILGKCNLLVEKTCDYLCSKLELKGVCDDDNYCICKAELEICYPWDCEKQCLEDVRAKECAASGGFVTPVGCLKYGPIRTCGCLCNLLGKKTKIFNVPKKSLNVFVSHNAKKVIQL